jgi:hypothetical protein
LIVVSRINSCSLHRCTSLVYPLQYHVVRPNRVPSTFSPTRDEPALSSRYCRRRLPGYYQHCDDIRSNSPTSIAVVVASFAHVKLSSTTVDQPQIPEGSNGSSTIGGNEDFVMLCQGRGKLVRSMQHRRGHRIDTPHATYSAPSSSPRLARFNSTSLKFPQCSVDSEFDIR